MFWLFNLNKGRQDLIRLRKSAEGRKKSSSKNFLFALHHERNDMVVQDRTGTQAGVQHWFERKVSHYVHPAPPKSTTGEISLRYVQDYEAGLGEVALDNAEAQWATFQVPKKRTVIGPFWVE
jgi:hypothetical protein